MITVVLIFSLLISSLICFAVFRRRLFLYPKSENENLRSAPKAASLFAPTDEEIRAFEKQETEKLNAERRGAVERNLTERANDSDFDVLIEAKESGDSEIYRNLLDLLAEKNKLEPSKFERLIAFVSHNDLPASENLAKTVLDDWTKNPSATSPAKVLHVSALTDSAENYLNAVETVFDLWRQKGLEKVSSADLAALFDSHYRLLSTESRTSGAGFLLKEKLASVRREVSGK